MELDYGNLESALNYVAAVTGRSMEDSMKRAGLHTIIGSGSYPGAMKLTPKATKAGIDLVSNREIQGFIVKKLRAAGRWPVSHAEVTRLMALERARRKRSIGYAAFAGWNNAAIAMGGHGINFNLTDSFPKSEASQGYGRVDSSGIGTEVTIANTAPAAERIGFEALQAGLDNAAADLVDYADKKLGKIFEVVNAT